ncbi:UPF0182 family protein [Sporosalibacterium faouarense]|uniref:UPF0182 family membrane protein n=1 Tax=Sporosalibacterium faouarense TaxID=516123 RepID=UPI00141C3E3A|nr:UPF0182 family protein [Sporosalibacterium faouarense]MTI48746.1 UPF0182 family protein [Bacillota bacterium]
MNRKTKYITAVGIIIVIFIISSFSSIIEFVTDYKWFNELGYTKTFLTKLVTQFKIGIPAFLILFGLMIGYLLFIKKRYYKDVGIMPDKKGERKLNVFLGLISALLSFFVSSIISGNLWFSILQFINSTKFNTNDPIFNKDLSFYIFKLPLIKDIMNILLLIIFLFIISTVVFYLVLITLRRPKNEAENVFDFNEFANNGKVNINKIFNKKLFKRAWFQIGISGLMIFIIIAINYYLRAYDLLYSTRGEVFGASYTDVHVSLWLYRIMAIGALVSGIGFLIGVLKKNIKLALTGPVIMIVVSIIGGLAGVAVEKYIVEPDQISKELPYLAHNIEYTQKAYGLEDVVEKDFPVEQNLTKEDLLENQETIKNIRINDYRPIKQVYFQLQGIRPYYKFNDIDVGRYTINDEYTQVFLSARELDQKELDSQAQNWINLHLKYTHGYGFTLSPVNSVTSEGQPELLVKDIPPKTDTNLVINRPEIYFGEMTNNYVILNTDEEEFDYPQGSSNAYTTYKGTAGIKLNGLNKLLFSIKQRDLKLLISGNITSDSRIVLNRNIADRVRKIAPFIQYDDDPYLVVNQEDGKLYWIIEGYTASQRYPYSQPYNSKGINYIRNSVKIVIDAYNGDAKYYVMDENDPVIMTYKNIFPDLFSSKEDMPVGIEEHLRYSHHLFDIQSNIYRAYHMNNPEVFFAREDYWAIAQEKYMEDILNVESNYVMVKLPEEEKAEFLLTVPYTPNNKDNMTALFVGRNDGANYGQLILYKFPKSKNIRGPMQVESRIDQDSNISPQLSLWDQKGSTVLRGNLITIPVEDSLLYVEPIYLKADNENSLPEVKRVIVAYEDRIVMEETLDRALSQIFGQVDQEKDDSGVIDDIDTDVEDENVKSIIQKANQLFNQAKEASREGNWSEYGEYINQLEEILGQLDNYYSDDNIDE